MTSLIAFGLPGGGEWIVIGLIGLLLFGKRLPEVARSLGKSVTEFKKGLNNIEDSVNQAVNEADKPEKLLTPPGDPPATTTTPEHGVEPGH